MLEKIGYLIAELKAARTQKGLSQQALGEKIGLPQSHISNIEKGTVDLKISTLIDIARAVELDVVIVSKPLAMMVRQMMRGIDGPSTPLYQLDDDED